MQQLQLFDTDDQISTPPIAYRADGHQGIVVSSGHDLATFMLAEQQIPAIGVHKASVGATQNPSLLNRLQYGRQLGERVADYVGDQLFHLDNFNARTLACEPPAFRIEL